MGLRVTDNYLFKETNINSSQKFNMKKMKQILLISFVSLFFITSLNMRLTQKSFSFLRDIYGKNQIMDLYYETPQKKISVDIVMSSTNTIPEVKQSISNTDFLDKTVEESIALQFGKYFKIKPKLISQNIDRTRFETWLEEETKISLQNLKNNIADDNLNSLTTVYKNTGIVEGTVLASPSQSNPNYFYDWTRDSAITMNTIVNVLQTQMSEEKAKTEFVPLQFSCVDVKLFGTVLKYMNKTYEIQRIENLSGKPLLQGLGEPKWNVDGTAFMGSWGRPQNDGPALRATTMIHFLNSLQQFGYKLEDVYPFLEPTLLNKTSLVFDTEEELFNKVIYYDLKFVVDNWHKQSFDLWEELNGNHFFTSVVQLNSMRLGINYLKQHLDWECPSGTSVSAFINTLDSTYNLLLSFIENEAGFVNELTNHIIENPQYRYKRSGLDISTLIAAVLTHDPISDDLKSPMPYNYNNTLVLNSLHGLTESMQVLYPINHPLNSLNMGVALGRYPEDVYNGNGESEGNPWFLATATGAQYLYGFVNLHLKNKMDLKLDASLDEMKESFWHNIFDFSSSSIRDVDANFNLVIPYGSKMYIETIQRLLIYADSFLDQIRKHVSDQGNMSEQFNKYTGFQEGARDLTWSYGTFWNTASLRTLVNKEFQKLELQKQR